MPDLNKTVEEMDDAIREAEKNDISELKAKANELMARDAVERIMAKVAMPKDNIGSVIEKGADIGMVKELWKLQQEFDRVQAIKAFNKAMAKFKAEDIHIERTATAKVRLKNGQQLPDRKYADLADVCRVLAPAMAKHGLSYNWYTDITEGLVSVSCVIIHEEGHAISTGLSGRPDETGFKNPIQAVGSTVEYLKRYTLLALSGVPTEGLDTDGGKASEDAESDGGGTLTNGQIGSLQNLAKATGKRLGCEITMERLAEALDVKSIEQADYNTAIKQIKEWRA